MIKTSLITIWNLLDPVYYSLSNLKQINSKTIQKSIFRVRLTKYKGPNYTLSDGTVIKRNDLLVKIHLYNIKILKEIKTIDNNVKKALLVYKYVKESLPDLVVYINNHVCKDDIKAIIGITTLEKGTKRLGFDSFPITSPFYKWFKQLSWLPLTYLFSYKVKNHYPVYLFMSKQQLSNKYGQKAKV
ncbi:YkoP family protein [Aquibacillus albus]|uniref:YkoP-like domain-containing protein n=1 Tax=Aquibacillus albus TaxID=1168171 RepID=A0ABS2N225_9BACI|nr:hypothetical protein [Aquibacillus albus]MBM7572146.1 hypothetical protein [Aquibacillus albus]